MRSVFAATLKSVKSRLTSEGHDPFGGVVEASSVSADAPVAWKPGAAPLSR